MGFNYSNSILLIPDKDDSERDAVSEVWIGNGGEVLRIGKFWAPPSIAPEKSIKIYGNSMFCLILAEKLRLKLVSPDDYILSKVDYTWIKRKIDICELQDAVNIDYPIFIKSLIPKIFSAKVYSSYEELKEECKQLDGNTPIIVSEIVSITAEVRSFILNGKQMVSSLYEGSGDVNEANQFIQEFLKVNNDLFPSTFVLDVGDIPDKGWSIIETNSTWGAGLNGCDAEKVVDCIANAVE